MVGHLPRYNKVALTKLNNVKANGSKIAISVYNAQNLEGYQIKGTAEYITADSVVDTL